jgi:hypothetical protein
LFDSRDGVHVGIRGKACGVEPCMPLDGREPGIEDVGEVRAGHARFAGAYRGRLEHDYLETCESRLHGG